MAIPLGDVSIATVCRTSACVVSCCLAWVTKSRALEHTKEIKTTNEANETLSRAIWADIAKIKSG
jgi:hypothetical protein